MNPWDGEIASSEEIVRALVVAQFPELLPIHAISWLGRGWDNDVWRVNDRVFRLPRRELAITLLEQERRLLPMFASKLPLAIPEPVHLGSPSDSFPHIFNGYAYLPGETACVIDPDEARRASHAIPLAAFLRQLHAIPLGDRCADESASPFASGDLTKRRRWYSDQLEALRRVGVSGGEIDACLELVEALAEGLVEARAEERCWIHGDLYTRHILLDEEREELVAIIDWGDTCWGDPAIDLGVAFGYLPASAHEAFFAHHGTAIDSMTWRRALFTSLRHGIALKLYGEDIEDMNLVRESDRIRARFILETSRWRERTQRE